MLREKKSKILCHSVSVMVTLAFVALGVFVYQKSFFRLVQSIVQFGLSFAYYFCFLFEIPNKINVPILDAPIYSAPNSETIIPDTILPQSLNIYEIKIKAWGNSLLNGATYSGFFGEIGGGLSVFLHVFLIVLPIFVLLYFVFKKVLFKTNNLYDKDTFCLKTFKAIAKNTYQPMKKAARIYWDFLQTHKFYRTVWLLIWAYNLNLIGAMFSMVAFVFYFVCTFDFLHIYSQIYALICDLSITLTGLPAIAWVIVAGWLFCRWRKKVAYRILSRMERRNRGFLNDLPLVIFGFGTMGAKKTMTITDMCLSVEAIFRREAFERLLKTDMRFPNFPWINLENELKRAMKYHQVYNLATVKIWCDKKENRFVRSGGLKSYFGYDWERYGAEFNNGLYCEMVFEAVKTYAQLYFIYVIESSLIVSAYAIRSDAFLRDNGNFPLWNDDFFNRDPKYIDYYSRHSHILDYDTLRLGQKMVADNEKSGAFEFGVVAISEIGKERGNALELQSVKKNADETNQKNDMFNERLKMARHSATVDYYPFVRFFVDDQRPESWGADARDLCTLFSISKKTQNMRLALPFYSLEGLFSDFLQAKFEAIYSKYRFLRGDNCLFMYLVKTISAKLYQRNLRVLNEYGYNELVLSTASGRMDAKPIEHCYYLANKKILAKRYSTDCYSEVFDRNVLKTQVGINDFDEYQSEKATFDELVKQNSYFVRDLLRIGGSGKRNN